MTQPLQPPDLDDARAMVDRFVRRFDESYRLLAAYAALPLVLTPELLNYLRIQFLRGQVPWVAEADLLLSELFREVGYEQYAMDSSVRAYLLTEMERSAGHTAMQEVARLLIQYIGHLSRTSAFKRDHDLQAQQWAAMIYLDEHREQAAHEIATAFERAAVPSVAAGVDMPMISQAELARLSRIVQELTPQLEQYPDLISYAQDVSHLLRDPASAMGTGEPTRMVMGRELVGPAIALGITLPEKFQDTGATSKSLGNFEKRQQQTGMYLPSARRFVNRLKELATVKHLVAETQSRVSARECVLNFYGVPGIGKSALLAEIYQSYKQDLALLTIAIDLKVLSESIEPFDLHHAKIQFIHELARNKWLKNHQPEAVLSIATIGSTSDDNAIEQAMSALVAAISGFDKPIMLLIDSWEHAPEAMLAWVERLLLLPLVRKEQLISLLGSQVALRWRQFEVRRRVQPYELAPLAADASKEQIGCEADLEQLIFEITAGLPFANEIMYAYLADQPISAEWLLEHREQLARIIAAETQQRVVNGIPEEVKPIFNILSIFREFDVHTLQTILPQFLETFRSRSQSNLLQSVKQMVATRLVNWNDTLRAYQIDPTIRKIFARAQEWGDPKLYQLIREAALKYYAQLLGEVPSNRHVYLLELLYHRLYKAPAGSYNSAELKTEFEELLRNYYTSRTSDYADTYALDQLHQLLLQDKELEQALERHQMPPTLLASILDSFITKLPPTSPSIM
jgi:hypothetical protein